MQMIFRGFDLRSPVYAVTLVAVGLVLTAFGVYSNFKVETELLISRGNAETAFLEDAYMPSLLAGLLLILIGSLLWVFRAQVRARTSAIVGSAVAILGFAAGELTPINIHGWTASLMLAYVMVVFVGLLLMVISVVRLLLARRSPSRTKQSEVWPK